MATSDEDSENEYESTTSTEYEPSENSDTAINETTKSIRRSPRKERMRQFKLNHEKIINKNRNNNNKKNKNKNRNKNNPNIPPSILTSSSSSDSSTLSEENALTKENKNKNIVSLTSSSSSSSDSSTVSEEKATTSATTKQAQSPSSSTGIYMAFYFRCVLCTQYNIIPYI